ncbi:hypothetical protein LCGC14_2384960, partial [marine sediment metagenome]
TLVLLGTWKYRFRIDEEEPSAYNSTWIYFNVIIQPPNFEGISESEYTTRWVLTSTATTGYTVEEFTEDLSGSNWYLSLSGEDSFYEFPGTYLEDNTTATSDVWIYTGEHWDTFGTNQPQGIAWGGTNFWVTIMADKEAYEYTSDGVYTGDHFDTPTILPNEVTGYDGTHIWILNWGGVNSGLHKYRVADGAHISSFITGAEDTQPMGVTWDGSEFWVLGGGNKRVYKYWVGGVYAFFSFDVSGEGDSPRGITWDGTHFWVVNAGVVYQYNAGGVYTGINFIVGGEDIVMNGITWKSPNFWLTGLVTKEAYEYGEPLDISKKYQAVGPTGQGFVYIQTDETETLELNTPAINLDLISADKITIDFNTTSTNKIDLKLMSGGSELKSIEISPQGNSDFTDKTVVINIDANYTIDKLQLEGIFTDMNNLYIQNVSIYRYSFITEEDLTKISVDPDGVKQVFLEYPNTYISYVFEQDLLVYTFNLTLGSSFETIIYKVPKIRDCYITFYDSNNEYLSFNLFITYINYTFDDDPVLMERMTDNII